MELAKNKLLSMVRNLLLISILPLTMLPYNTFGKSIRIGVLLFLLLDLFYLRPKFSNKSYIKNAINIIIVCILVIAAIVLFAYKIDPTIFIKKS